MRFVDLAVDLVAVLNASRSVASKHIALRSRQLDAYTGDSSIAASWRSVKPSREAATSRDGGGAAGSPEATETTPSVGTGAHGKVARAPETKKASAKTDIGGPEARNTSSRSSPFASIQHDPRSKKNVSRDLNAPSDVDVGIFHTARGSRILESLKEKNAADTTSAEPRGPAREHPLRYWPHGPPAEDDNPIPSSNDSAVQQTSSAVSPRLDAPPAPEPRTQDASPVQTTPTRVDEKTMGIASESVNGKTPSPTAYKLRESKVPASRFSRLWNYGGLAAGMLGGAMTESVSRAFGGGGQGSVMLSGKNMERLVARLSRMRGAALKLGQMMSLQDAKMLPAPIQEVLQRVQDKADYMPTWQRDRVLVSNLGENWRDLYSEFEETPMAAASIGQVHKAVLKSNGRKVAVKIQFPGVAASIDSDLDNLGILLNATKLLPKGLYLDKTIDNARVELGWECDYEREAQCARRYKKLLQGEDVLLAPDVHPEASGKQVLTMDFMEGVGVTRVQSFTQEQRDWIGTHIMRLCLREITEFRFMQTDPNWTNFLYNADLRKLELVDFGASREYPEGFVRQYVQLLEAASRADRDAVRALSQGLGYLTGHESKAMLDAHVDSVLTLAEPFGVAAPRVYDFKGQTITDRVGALIPVMLRERLAPPPEETYSLHRKLSGAFLLCARLGSRVACRDMFAAAIDKSGYV
ncbi:hypothetical protein G6O67_003847 [Ophiocordyceps sinensis]|uniref:ABC1 atypical kinase-like domain-containing protein n=2 Tax=Ophiocordyceps sinensis TaxID=72228 RepID=A0A8H4V6F8_9HYPO|nr:hypothetical protein G6O67_003847 [Ophiocordyceps sinensis]